MRRTRLMTLGAVVCLVVASGSLWAEDQPPNLLPNPGFENLDESFVKHGTVLEKGQSTHFRSWSVRCENGRLKMSGDAKELTEGRTSLKIEFLSTDSGNKSYLHSGMYGLRPNTIYELGGMIKAQNVDWVLSQYRIYEYDEDGGRLRGTIRRSLNYPSSDGFLERKVWWATGPGTRKGTLAMYWLGSPVKDGPVQRPSMVWLDDLKLVEVGPLYPASGEFLREDFEGEELHGWILSQIGAHWNPTGPGFGDARNPQISEEKAHSGKKSLKLFPTWGAITRPFAENITNCVVTVWFYEEPDRCRMVMLVDESRRQAGLGTIRESVSNYACRLDGKFKVTDVKKSGEWHEFKFDVTEGKGTTCYIDNVKVGHTDQFDSFRALHLGENFWAGSTCYIDDISIQLKD